MEIGLSIRSEEGVVLTAGRDSDSSVVNKRIPFAAAVRIAEVVDACVSGESTIMRDALEEERAAAVKRLEREMPASIAKTASQSAMLAELRAGP